MLTFHDIRMADEPWTKRQYDRWFITSEPYSKSHKLVVDAICICGTERAVACADLERNQTRSCGCGRGKKRSKFGPGRRPAGAVSKVCDNCGNMPHRRPPKKKCVCGGVYQALPELKIESFMKRRDPIIDHKNGD